MAFFTAAAAAGAFGAENSAPLYHEQVAFHGPAYAVPFYDHGLTSADQAEHYLRAYVDSTHESKQTLLTNMLDFAIDNISIGLEFIQNNPSAAGHEARAFFNDTVRALLISKDLAQSGMYTADFLRRVEHQMEEYKADLLTNGTEYEHHLASYLDVALKELDTARYLDETHHVHMANQNSGSFEHQNQINGMFPTGHIEPSSPYYHDIYGPVLIAGDQAMPLPDLLRHHLPSAPAYHGPVLAPHLIPEHLNAHTLDGPVFGEGDHVLSLSQRTQEDASRLSPHQFIAPNGPFYGHETVHNIDGPILIAGEQALPLRDLLSHHLPSAPIYHERRPHENVHYIEGPLLIAGDHAVVLSQLQVDVLASQGPQEVEAADKADEQLLSLWGRSSQSSSRSTPRSSSSSRSRPSYSRSSSMPTYRSSSSAPQQSSYRPSLRRSQSAPEMRYSQQPQPSQQSTWAQTIYQGADKIGNYATQAGWAGTAAVFAPDPTGTINAGGASLAVCAKVVKGVCVLTKAGARYAGGGPVNAYGIAGDAGGMLETAGEVAGELGRATLGEYAEAGSQAIAAGRLGYQGINRWMGRRPASTDALETAEDTQSAFQGGADLWQGVQGMMGG